MNTGEVGPRCKGPYQESRHRQPVILPTPWPTRSPWSVVLPTRWQRIVVPGVCGYNMGYLETCEGGGILTARIHAAPRETAFKLIEACWEDQNPFGHPRVVELGAAGGAAPHDVRPFVHPELGLCVIWAYAAEKGPPGHWVWGQRYAPLDLTTARVGEIKEIPRAPGVNHKNVIPHGDHIIYHPGRREHMKWDDLRIRRHPEPLGVELRGGTIPIRLNSQWSLAAFHTTLRDDTNGWVYEAWMGFVDNSGVVFHPVFLDTHVLLADVDMKTPTWQPRKIRHVVFPMGIYALPAKHEFVVIAGVQDQATYAIHVDADVIAGVLAEGPELSHALEAP